MLSCFLFVDGGVVWVCICGLGDLSVCIVLVLVLGRLGVVRASGMLEVSGCVWFLCACVELLFVLEKSSKGSESGCLSGVAVGLGGVELGGCIGCSRQVHSLWYCLSVMDEQCL